MTKQNNLTPFDLATIAANVAESKKALDTVVLDTGRVSYLADYFVICSGESRIQVKAIADAIQAALEKERFEAEGRENDGSGRWVLQDYGSLVIHVLNREEREHYQLEKFWSHADLVDRKEWLTENRQAS